MKKRTLIGVIVGTLGLVLVLASIALLMWRHCYPYGARTACLPLMVSALIQYSSDNGGWFPDGGPTPVESLMKVYQDYVYPDLLAGLSGDRKKLRMGKGQYDKISVLDSSASSWVYFPGLRYDDVYQADDYKVAIIWEREAGITFNGRRVEAGSHAVGFTDGHWEQIPAAEWNAFLASQEQLRHKILLSRNSSGP